MSTTKTYAVLNHFRKNDPIMHSLAKTHGVVPVKKRNAHFSDICYAIIGQQLSGKAADTIFKRFTTLFPDEKITPEIAAKLKERQIRNIGASWAKAGFITDLGKKVSSGGLNLKSISKMSDAEAISSLTKVKGIGPWTAEMFLMFTMGREDVFSHGDLGLRKAVIMNYKLKNPSRDKIENIAAKWSPYRTYACRLLWRSLEA